MAPTALLITHLTQPGSRDAVEAVWRTHMAPAVADNSGHDAYFYRFDDTDPDVICAFQQYRSGEDAREFLATEAYRAYEIEVAPLLNGPPEVRRLTPIWTKPSATTPLHP